MPHPHQSILDEYGYAIRHFVPTTPEEIKEEAKKTHSELLANENADEDMIRAALFKTGLAEYPHALRHGLTPVVDILGFTCAGALGRDTGLVAQRRQLGARGDSAAPIFCGCQPAPSAGKRIGPPFYGNRQLYGTRQPLEKAAWIYADRVACFDLDRRDGRQRPVAGHHRGDADDREWA